MIKSGSGGMRNSFPKAPLGPTKATILLSSSLVLSHGEQTAFIWKRTFRRVFLIIYTQLTLITISNQMSPGNSAFALWNHSEMTEALMRLNNNMENILIYSKAAETRFAGNSVA